MPSSDKDPSEGSQTKKSRVDLQSMPIRQVILPNTFMIFILLQFIYYIKYLDQAVVPVVLQALSAVAKER